MSNDFKLISTNSMLSTRLLRRHLKIHSEDHKREKQSWIRILKEKSTTHIFMTCNTITLCYIQIQFGVFIAQTYKWTTYATDN